MKTESIILLLIAISIFLLLFTYHMDCVRIDNFNAIPQSYPDIAIDIDNGVE